MSSEFATFRKKPVDVKAVQVPQSLVERSEIVELLKKEGVGHSGSLFINALGALTVVTLEGNMVAKPGYWLIVGVVGEIYPCRNDIFEQTYERVENG